MGFQPRSLMARLKKIVGVAPATAQTDAQLLARFQAARDEAAFAALLERHGPMVLGVCRRLLANPHDVDDAYQAVFIVLARKAGALTWSDSIAGWLHAVACRIALKTRGATAQRLAREQEIIDMPLQPTSAELPAELREVLDEELQRLPARYRDPLVLCYLNGQSNEEAARQLGRPVGTVWYQLSKGRELLRSRLARRGIALSAVLLTPLMEANTLSAAVPAGLQAAALQAGLAAPLGHDALVHLVSPRTLSLAEGALHTMFLKKIKLAVAAVAALVLVAVGIGVNSQLELARAVPIADNKIDAAPKGDLQAILIANQNTYVLDLALLKQVEVFNNARKVIRNNAANIRPIAQAGGPGAQRVDLVLELRNNTDKPIRIADFGVENMNLKLELSGPGVEDVKFVQLRQGINLNPLPAPIQPVQPGANAPAVLPVAPAVAPAAPVDPAVPVPANVAPAAPPAVPVPVDPNVPRANPVPAVPATAPPQADPALPAKPVLPAPKAAPAPLPVPVIRRLPAAPGQPVLPVQPGGPAAINIIEIAPGKSHKLTIDALKYLDAREIHQLYWTKAGKYELKASVTIAVSPSEAKLGAQRAGTPEGFGQRTITSLPVTLVVTEK